MKKLSRFFRYLGYFLTAETKELRAEAFEAAKRYYAARPLRTAQNLYPHPIDYSRRREEFTAFQRGYINQRCSEVALRKLSTK